MRQPYPSGFGRVSWRERRQADRFFADLTGRPLNARGRTREVESWAEGRPLVQGPLSESEWRSVLFILSRAEAQVGAPLTTDSTRNALLVAARIFCDRNALSLERQDPLLCLINDVTLLDPRVRALVPHVIAKGPIVDWTRTTSDARVLVAMTSLVRNYGFPMNGAAGLVGNLLAESGVMPQRVEGSAGATPMRAAGFEGKIVDFSAEDVMNRNQSKSIGPKLPGVGLAQWTTPERRAGLFAHTFKKISGARTLFDIEAQIDYLVKELRTLAPGVLAVLTNPAVTVDAACDEVLFNFEAPGSIIAGGVKLPRTNPAVIAVFGQRRPLARHAARIFEAVNPLVKR